MTNTTTRPDTATIDGQPGASPPIEAATMLTQGRHLRPPATGDARDMVRRARAGMADEHVRIFGDVSRQPLGERPTWREEHRLPPAMAADLAAVPMVDRPSHVLNDTIVSAYPMLQAYADQTPPKTAGDVLATPSRGGLQTQVSPPMSAGDG